MSLWGGGGAGGKGLLWRLRNKEVFVHGQATDVWLICHKVEGRSRPPFKSRLRQKAGMLAHSCYFPGQIPEGRPSPLVAFLGPQTSLSWLNSWPETCVTQEGRPKARPELGRTRYPRGPSPRGASAWPMNPPGLLEAWGSERRRSEFQGDSVLSGREVTEELHPG